MQVVQAQDIQCNQLLKSLVSKKPPHVAKYFLKTALLIREYSKNNKKHYKHEDNVHHIVSKKVSAFVRDHSIESNYGVCL